CKHPMEKLTEKGLPRCQAVGQRGEVLGLQCPKSSYYDGGTMCKSHDVDKVTVTKPAPNPLDAAIGVGPPVKRTKETKQSAEPVEEIPGPSGVPDMEEPGEGEDPEFDEKEMAEIIQAQADIDIQYERYPV